MQEIIEINQSTLDGNLPIIASNKELFNKFKEFMNGK